jgi:hypothetical protein
MKLKNKILLFIDCIVNLFLGVILLLFPFGIIEFFGLPPTNTHFYPSILGAVILGIGFALLLEIIGYERNISGLGLGGAIAINIIGSFALICWLIFGSLNMPLRGQIVLWIVSVIVLLIGVVEFSTKSWRYDK